MFALGRGSEAPDAAPSSLRAGGRGGKSPDQCASSVSVSGKVNEKTGVVS